MKHTSLCLALLACLLAACSGEKKFKVTGEIAGNPSINLYVKYFAADGVQSAIAAASDGKFEFEGSSPEPVLLEILDNENNVLGRAYVQDGDEVKLTLDRHNPFNIKAEGSDVNSRWADAMRAVADTLYSGTPASVNAFVEKYIAGHPDDVVGTLIFLTCYDSSVDPLRADSVLGSIKAEARPGVLTAPYSLMARRAADPAIRERADSIHYRTAASDSALVYRPADSRLSLLAFSDEDASRATTVVPCLAEIRRAFPDRERLGIVDFVVTADTTTFKSVVRRDTLTVTQAWVPGGLFARGVERLSVPDLPYFIVVDSTGRQIYRGAEPEGARRVIDRAFRR